MKKLIPIIVLILSSFNSFSQCCGDGVCDPGETPLNCPYDCAPVSNWNCPNTIGSFYNDPNLPITYATAQANGYCYTIKPPYPTQVCFEYKKPPGGTINVQFMISDNCSGPGATTMSVGSNSTSCAGTSTSHPSILGLSTYGVLCNQISSSMSIGGGCGAIIDTIITICVTINTATPCTEIYICPIIDCNSNNCASSNGTIPCPPFNFSDSTYIDVCNTNPNTGIAVVTPDCGSHFTYLWDDPLAQTDSLAQNLTPGTYTVVITNSAFGCDTTISVTVDTLIPPSDASWTTPPTICEANGSINLNTLITGTNGGNWSGTNVTGNTFNPSGLNGNIPITYIVGTTPCFDTVIQNINVIPDVDPSLTIPNDTICEANGVINLNNYINGTTGGTWSGTGVSGNTFNPASLSGNITITYTVGSNPCTESSTIIINVQPNVDPSLTAPNDTICEANGVVNLNNYINGTAGGTWSGTGVTGNIFNPASLSGNITITYTVGNSPCSENSSIIINVIPDANPSLTQPNDTICEAAGNINLTVYENGTTGGLWSGVGVTGASFNPTGLNGNITLTYSVGINPCIETNTLIINVIPDVNPSLTQPNDTLCEATGNINLTVYENGTNGGTWSGIGVTGNTFDPTGLSGPITLTYTVGVGKCIETNTIIINVIPDVDPSLTTSNDTICEANGSINLNNYINGTTGGVWSGTGVSGNTFNPASLSGNITITYTVGINPCAENSTIIINVQPDDTASFSYNAVYCLTSTNPIAIITGTPGGTFSISNPGVLNNSTTGEVNLSSSGIGTFWIYYSTASAGNYCPTVDSIQITITPSPIATFNYNKTIYCQNDTPNPTPNYGPNGFPGTFSSNPNGVVFTNTSTGEINLLSSTSGTYWIVNNLPANGGCAAHIDSIQITINPSYFIQLNTSICQGDSILLANSYQTSGGVYYDSLNTFLGCDSIIETTLTINPSFTFVLNDSICQGDSILLGGSFQNIAGTYYDSLITNFGCDSIIQTNLTINNLPMITSTSDTSICNGMSVNISAFGASNYFWDNGLGSGQNHNVTPVSTITYVVTGTNPQGCSDTSSLTITVEPSTIAYAGPDQEICDNITTFTLNANSPINIGEVGTWTSFGPIVNSPNNPNSSGSGLNSGANNFIWTIVNGICPTSSDTVVILLDNCEPSSLLIPNIFTPNGDGMNDFFTIEGIKIKSIDCEIYNRWGQLLASWTHINGAWDGRTLSGTEVPDGTYFYIIKATGEDEVEHLQKSGFSLIR